MRRKKNFCFFFIKLLCDLKLANNSFQMCLCVCVYVLLLFCVAKRKNQSIKNNFTN